MYILDTRVVIGCDTLEFFPHTLSFPKVNTEAYLHQATSDMNALLTSPVAHLTYLQVGNETLNAVLQISKLLNHSIDQVVDLNQQ